MMCVAARWAAALDKILEHKLNLCSRQAVIVWIDLIHGRDQQHIPFSLKIVGFNTIPAKFVSRMKIFHDVPMFEHMMIFKQIIPTELMCT